MMVPVHTKQVLNSSKVSDHHAIIPTENVSDADYSEIPSGEQKILGLVTARLFSSVGDSVEITEYALEVECAGEVFKAKSKCITSPGWHLLEDWILGKKQDDGEDDSSKKDDGDSHGILEILEADASLLAEGRELPARDPKVKDYLAAFSREELDNQAKVMSAGTRHRLHTGGFVPFLAIFN